MPSFWNVLGFILIVVGAGIIGFMDINVLPDTELEILRNLSVVTGMSLVTLTNKVLALAMTFIGWRLISKRKIYLVLLVAIFLLTTAPAI